jgi:hypothetical protein
MEKTCAYCGETFEALRITAMFCSEAHKKAYARQRKQTPVTIGVGHDAIIETPTASTPEPAPRVEGDPGGEISGGDLDGELEPGTEELLEWEGKLRPAIRTQYVSEDEYVHAEIEITRGLLRRGLKDPDGQRVARTERYARWRYRGWLVGEIHSL